MVDWIKCSYRNPTNKECPMYDYESEEYYGVFLVTVELSNGSRFSKQAYYRPKSDYWYRAPDDFTEVKPVVAWSPMVDPLYGSKDNGLEQYKGEDNPLNTLLFLSLEIGNSLLEMTKRISDKQNMNIDITTSLIQKYYRIIQGIHLLSKEEIQFLYDESQVEESRNMVKRIKSMQGKINTQLSTNVQLANRDFLLRTYGAVEGDKEYRRRLRLHKLSKLITDDSLLDDAIGYVLGDMEMKDDVKVLFKKAKGDLSLWDLEYIKDIRKYKFDIG